MNLDLALVFATSMVLVASLLMRLAFPRARLGS